MSEVDYCVVGAGFAGLTAALRLQQGGRSVALLEARDRGGRCSPTPAAAAAGGPRTPDVLAALRKSAHPGALAVLKESCRAEDIETARVAITAPSKPKAWPNLSPTRRSFTPAARSRWPGPG